jgi:RNA polymerase sigma-70 factor (ECF subfamily)
METLNNQVWNEIIVRLREFVYRKVKDREVANDIVQDVFLKVQAKISQLREPKKLTNWIFQITLHTIMDYFRTKKKILVAAEFHWDNEVQELNDCVAYCLNQLLDTLPAKYREAIRLTEVENLSQTALAEHLGISYSGAKSRVQRARQMLRDKLHNLYKIKTDPYGNIIACEDKLPCSCTPQYGEEAVML